ncbi:MULTISPECIES: efflux RND transporter permease subunit [Methylomonas]|uniref:Acriflavin resistance protein n=2 Tax=Methylomonas TaxID=416 RepID=A0A126T8C5_9GAMM|nr:MULTISPECIES: CusA/CzcA family heavy metal efflux RND transporter [Methylomonas]AMK78024.1 acriflavin resistance protein [Methylomonas denitrificans]OAI07678.1 acriflavin resistance protein [Methylomonas methanica]TCV85559.1 cobalt-zinc-cadmium resistance protein CzcA [Methylomonas methanica]
MIERLIAFCLQQRLMVIGATLAIAVSGIIAFENLPVQAFPDVQNVFVQVVTQFPGQAPEEVEKQISLPIEREMNGLPHLMNMRSVSIFGLSVVTLTFDDKAEDYFSRQQVLERLQYADIPSETKPQLGPLSTGVGEILRYVIDAKNLPLVEQRALQDWIIEPRLRSVQGVADVVGFGGGVKEYKVAAKPDRLKNYRIDLNQVFQAIAANNTNTGGGYIEHGDEALVVRGTGLLKSADEIGEIVITTNDGVPVRIKDVADISVGPQPRNGMVGMNQHDDVVEGIVLLIKGRDAVNVLDGVKQKIKELNDFGLPPGVKITPFYDRTELVGHTIHTVEHNMIEGAVLILIILLVFLRRFVAALLVTLIIPLSLLFAFILVDLGGISANLISLGAIDFGIIVDGAVVLVEAVMVQVTLDLQHNADMRHLRQSLLTTAKEMGRPILFSKAIIIIAFLPIFTFQRVEAKIFSPMAYTLSFALVASMLFSLTFVPAMLTYLLGPKLAEQHNPLVHAMEHHYRRTLEWVLRHARAVFIAAITALVLSFMSVKLIGTEFMPKLDEGNIWLTITLPTPVSLSTAKQLERQVRETLETFSEANTIITQLGRPEDGTDPKGFNNLEVLIDLKPKDTWRYKRKDDLVQAMDKALAIFPGILTNFSQVIQDNVEEAISGVKGEIAIKIFGSDLQTLQDRADQVTHILAGIQGATDVAAEQQAGLAQVIVDIDRAKVSRYGINVADVERVMEIGMGGKAASQFLEGERRFDITLRYEDSARNSVANLENLTVQTPSGQRIPLAELATIKINQGASRISREDNMRRIAIKCNLIDRDQGSFVAEAQQKVAAQVDLPPGYHIVWSGQFENQQRAMKRLAVIVPISLGLIFVLLFWAFMSIKNALLIVMNVPFAMIGGLLILLATGINLSVSAAVGFIALFGIAVQNGVILVSQLNKLRRDGQKLHDAIVNGSVSRLRPVVMTALMAMLGLFPAALSTSVGSETAKPFAIVIIGGLITATLLTLTLLPALYRYFAEPDEP